MALDSLALPITDYQDFFFDFLISRTFVVVLENLRLQYHLHAMQAELDALVAENR